MSNTESDFQFFCYDPQKFCEIEAFFHESKKSVGFYFDFEQGCKKRQQNFYPSLINEGKFLEFKR